MTAVAPPMIEDRFGSPGPVVAAVKLVGFVVALPALVLGLPVLAALLIYALTAALVT
jgi:hypothetical protein